MNRAKPTKEVVTHPRNIAGCCDGTGQVHHNASGDPYGPGALHYVTICPNHCAQRAWDAECEGGEVLEKYNNWLANLQDAS